MTNGILNKRIELAGGFEPAGPLTPRDLVKWCNFPWLDIFAIESLISAGAIRVFGPESDYPKRGKIPASQSRRLIMLLRNGITLEQLVREGRNVNEYRVRGWPRKGPPEKLPPKPRRKAKRSGGWVWRGRWRFEG